MHTLKIYLFATCCYAVSGHSTLAEVERCTRSVRQAGLAVRAMIKLEKGDS